MNQCPKTPSFQLDGRRALVAGATSGIGLGSAVALAQAGAEVTLIARRSDALDQVVTTIQEAGYKAQPLTLDITDLSMMTEKLKTHKPFDVLVNSVGTAKHSPALVTSEEDYQIVMDVNVKAAYFLSVGVAHGMKKAGKGGSIINISSQMGHVGGIDRAVYCASKFALEGMTKSMAIEWGPDNIRINTIAPTFVRTPLTQPTFEDPERVAWIKSKIKLPRIAEVEDIMGAVVFLASDAAAMITGTSLLIDGGWTAE